MSDIEAPRRAEAARRMRGIAECVELARVQLNGHTNGEVDVLCRANDPVISPFPFVIEIKNYPLVGDKQLGPWIKQCADYVGAIPANGWPPIAASFLWLVDMDVDTDEGEQSRMAGMIQLAQYFRVGTARDYGRGLVLCFGPSAGLFERGIWKPRAAEYLSAKRVSAGTRKPLSAFQPVGQR